MDAPKVFDPYDVIGVITPGTVLALLLVLHSSELRVLLGDKGLTAGDLGLFVMVAFVLGQMLTAMGRLVEVVVFVGEDLPTDTLRKTGQRILTTEQCKALEIKAGIMEGAPVELSTVGCQDWRIITARMAARVRAAGRGQRFEIHNRTFGMARGLTAAFSIAAVVYAWFHLQRIDVIALAVILALAAAMKMRSAGKHYARGLFIEFLDLDVGSKTPPVAP